MYIQRSESFIVPIVPFLEASGDLDVRIRRLALDLRGRREFLARVAVVEVLVVVDAQSENLDGADGDFSGGAVSTTDKSVRAIPETILITRFQGLE